MKVSKDIILGHCETYFPISLLINRNATLETWLTEQNIIQTGKIEFYNESRQATSALCNFSSLKGAKEHKTAPKVTDPKKLNSLTCWYAWMPLIVQGLYSDHYKYYKLLFNLVFLSTSEEESEFESIKEPFTSFTITNHTGFKLFKFILKTTYLHRVFWGKGT